MPSWRGKIAPWQPCVSDPHSVDIFSDVGIEKRAWQRPTLVLKVLEISQDYTAHRTRSVCKSQDDLDWQALREVPQDDLRGQVFLVKHWAGTHDSSGMRMLCYGRCQALYGKSSPEVMHLGFYFAGL